MSIVSRIALALLIVGGLNWGLIGLFQYDLVASIFGGQDSFLSRLVYDLVGLSALVCLGLLFKPSAELETSRRGQTRYSNPNLQTEFAEEFYLDKDQMREKK
ncbi:DUF378 domain-containing protein [Paenisporosarcina cavernae]|uniref:DUF378 domain-containing protein n=1 Tax=Paenisporosarcina cavernae TaxID=2320858 RepID=A0A385YRQ5_9BACL|nr:DUF378 domain-containing protein [Paenisporosarcina cavernae]AYC28428.1 DUF378 domain-containing protein [Paenisporosarcina cavernae]